jgi:hypothetical protein
VRADKASRSSFCLCEPAHPRKGSLKNFEIGLARSESAAYADHIAYDKTSKVLVTEFTLIVIPCVCTEQLSGEFMGAKNAT